MGRIMKKQYRFPLETPIRNATPIARSTTQPKTPGHEYDPMRPWLLLTLGVGLLAIVLALGWDRRGNWERPNPLIAPVGVVGIDSGWLVLEGGRRLRPAGITPRVDADTWDRFLRASSAQGVVVRRDIGNGTGVITAEPRFVNTCGTSRRRSNWQGSFVRADLSCLAILGGYAEESGESSELSEQEQLDLRGSSALWSDTEEPMEIMHDGQGFRYDSIVSVLRDFDGHMEYALTKVDEQP